MKNAIKRKHIKGKALFFIILILCTLMMVCNCALPAVASINNSYNNFIATSIYQDANGINNYYIPQIVKQTDKSISTTNLTSYENLKLYAGGMPFGVKFYTSGITVIGFSDISSNGIMENPASESGIMEKDIITHVNKKLIESSSDLTEAIEKSNGNPVKITVLRQGKELTFVLLPKYSDSDGTYRSGMLVRDSGAGIGTVTFIVPSNNYFGGLGHGICSAETGTLTLMREGTINNVAINGVKKGVPGTPGEVKGSFSGGTCGNMISNTECGLFGKYSTLPENISENLYSIRTKNNIHEGEAYILCTLGNDGVQQYKVNITNIDRTQTSSKCFSVTVIDENLISRSGGIVQGMSGSPIIQDGYIIGAVTHVLVNDPTQGYGIFIENMLRTLNEVS